MGNSTPKPAPNKTPVVICAPKPSARTPKPSANLTPTSIRATNPTKNGEK